ncbi:hypothetical protein GC209_09500 [bacterium]|nr:hypothetical protein [bacterium]
MAYDWIFDVLEDLKAFAEANGLTALAAKADEALAVARVEVAGLNEDAVKQPPRKSGPTH